MQVTWRDSVPGEAQGDKIGDEIGGLMKRAPLMLLVVESFVE